MYGRLTALPEQTEPSQLGQILAALCVGSEVIRLRRMAFDLALDPELSLAFASLAQGSSATAQLWLARLDRRLATFAAVNVPAFQVLRARASILTISETVARHAAYFDSGARE